MRTDMHSTAKTSAALLLLASLTACGGGGGFNTTTGGGSNGGGATSGTSLVELGNGVGGSFKQGVLDLQVSNLSAGGSTDVTATLVDANNANSLYTQSVTLTFTSNCVSAGTASLTSTVTTTSGTAIATYQAKGCSGSDIITASAAVGSTTLTATATLTVQPASIGTIQFISATPSAISLQGVGGNTSSKVTFQVNDVNGNPVPDQTVDFTLSTTSGGVTISPKTGVTDSTGQASTFVQAGTVHTSVNVTATVRNTGVSQTTPNAIAISTGVPVQSRMSISMTTHNLSRSFDHDGTTDTIDVFAVDRYGNPASPGTNILFTTSSGVIYGTCPGSTNVSTACGSCQTDSTGHCSVTWASAGNRPDPTTNNPLDVLGHAHILAYTAGEEHYTDNDADGIFDGGDTFSANTTDTFFGLNAPVGDNIGDPYMDMNENSAYDLGEPFADISASVTTRRSPDGKWYGAGCGGFGHTHASVAASGGTVNCANKLTMIGKDDCIVMSTDGALITAPTSTLIDHNLGLPTSTSVDITDANGNAIGSGSKIQIVSNNVSGVTLSLSPSDSSGTSYTVPDIGCKSTPTITFTVTAALATGATTFSGSFYILYTSQDGLTNVQSQTINIQ
jgi:hypothetical protein